MLASALQTAARRLHPLVETIHTVTYFAEEPTEQLMALGLRNYWDGYFAARSAPLGQVPAEVVDAIFYNFAPGEVARHIPRVWKITTPQAALAARDRGCLLALRRLLGDLADSPRLARAADLAIKIGTSASTEGRPLYAGLRTLTMPKEPVLRLWYGATLIREHRGDGHNAALAAAGIGRTEAHVLHALYEGIPAAKFGRVGHLPSAQLTAVVDGMRNRGLVDDCGWLSQAGRQIKTRIETATDQLAAAALHALPPAELDQLFADLEPICAVIEEQTPSF